MMRENSMFQQLDQVYLVRAREGFPKGAMGVVFHTWENGLVSVCFAQPNYHGDRYMYGWDSACFAYAPPVVTEHDADYYAAITK